MAKAANLYAPYNHTKVFAFLKEKMTGTGNTAQ
jgi:hypothetical protein